MTAALILVLVTLQRLAELAWSRRNERRLRARGAHEAGERHYPFIMLVHGLWLASLWLLAPGRAVEWLPLALFLLLQAGRIWVLATLGERWTTRIIVLPGAPLVRSGPYRLVRHPNYWIVAGEIALLPLAFGLPEVALIFTLANAAVLSIRLREEEKALAPGAAPKERNSE